MAEIEIPDDPYEVAVRFGAMLIGADGVSDDPPPPDSRLGRWLLLKEKYGVENLTAEDVDNPWRRPL